MSDVLEAAVVSFSTLSNQPNASRSPHERAVLLFPATPSTTAEAGLTCWVAMDLARSAQNLLYAEAERRGDLRRPRFGAGIRCDLGRRRGWGVAATADPDSRGGGVALGLALLGPKSSSIGLGLLGGVG